MSLLFLTDIINRVGLNPKEVKLIRHAFSHETFKKYYEMGSLHYHASNYIRQQIVQNRKIT